MRHLKLTIMYDGTDFGGWQVQPNARTVQVVLQEAIKSITQEARVNCIASGRTDSGVHALGQVVAFFTQSQLSCETLVKAINAKLPDDVAVLDCAEVSQSFCAIKDAVKKRYRYVIDDARVPNIFLRKYAWQPMRNIDADAMHRASQCLLGRHDFRCFETEWPNRHTSIRTITDILVQRQSDGSVAIEVEADGFLYNMVRAITGTLYRVGRGDWAEGKVKEVLEMMDRKEAGMTAPPQGLFMVKVTYKS
ncbi:tRNA pseudouridine(38-40) synthase TruA [soil metagenome]